MRRMKEMKFFRKGDVGFGLTALVGIVLAIVLGFVVWNSTNMARNASEITDWGECKTSVLLREQEKDYKLKTEPTQPFDCHTRFVEIDYGSGNPKKPEKRGNIVKYSVDTEEDLMESVARETAGCWWQMSAGEGNPFGSFGRETFGLGEDESRCVICSEIMFTDKLVSHFPSIGSAANTFDSYLKKNNFEYFGYINENYAELLGARGISDGDHISEIPNLITADERGKIPYSVIFYMGTESKRTEPAAGALIGYGLGALVCYGAATIVTVASGGIGAGTYILCGAVLAGGTVAGTGAGIGAVAISDEKIDVDYYPFWYIGDATTVHKANCDQLY